MYISKINIQNYRGIKNETLRFDKFNTLIGKNDCGKSTIINAIKLFFNDEKVAQKDYNFYSTQSKEIVITITISEYKGDFLKSFLVGGDKEDGFDEIVIDYIFDDTIVISKKWEYKGSSETGASTYIQVNNFETHKIHSYKATDISKWIKDLSVEIPVKGTGKNSDLENSACLRKKLIEIKEKQTPEFIEIKYKDIVNSLPSIEIFKADQSIETTTTEFKGTFATEIKSIIRSEKENGEYSTLAGIEKKISTKIKEESDVIQKCMSEHISDLSSLLITPSFSWEKGVEITNVEIQLTGDQKPIPLENKGSGYRRLFMVGRLRYLAEKKQSENVIYLVEEPETFLHPSSQEEMLYSLMSLSKLNQIFVTTHSPIFTGATKQNAITLCKKENTELKYEQREDDDFLLDIAKQLGIRASHNIIDTTTSFIFLEGKDDISFFAIAYEKFSGIKFPYDKVCILFGGGNTLDDFIRIKYFSELKDKHQKKLFLVVDSDKGNNEAKKIENNKRIVEKFNNKVSGMGKGWVLNKRYIESYYHKGALERIFTDKDFSDLIKNVFDDDFNVIEYLNSKGISVKKSKGNADIFLEMTQEEWTEVSSNELEGIFSEILPTNE